MTTAPDLPLAPAQFQPDDAVGLTRPVLTLVPSQPLAEPLDFDEALGRAFPRLKRYAVRRLLDDHEAEEVVQEAMLRAFQHKDALATEDDLMAWLTVVTGRLVIDRLRVRGRSTPMAELPPESRTGRDTADVVVARDEARLALDALEAMPTRQASVLWAREVEGLSYDEIGARFGMTEPSVRSVLHRARRTLRREYAVRGGTLPGVGLVALAPWLEGLRWAAKLRHVARRTTGAAAVAATGLAIATVVPFSAHTTHLHPHPGMDPALTVRTVAAKTTKPAATRAVHPAAPVATAASTASKPSRPTFSQFRHTPRVCDAHAAGHSLSAGCEAPHTPTLYLNVPVTVVGPHSIGVSNDSQLCQTVPTTLVTECDRSTASPSKGSQS